ncbi:enolase [Perkinsela sp. CCAP 1560/4]|nr:enolase [Perkinsela sp. CCAP 1560/4]|eukprot:KNH07435.1 enolase [Perkinsela sp. CCAP 1560/4]
MLLNQSIKRDSIVCGLANLGNSCYANTIIQVLVNQSAFVNALLDTEVSLQDQKAFNSERKSLRSFRHLVQLMENESGYVKPSKFLHNAFALSPDDFSINQQGDACELLLLLLSKWEESFKISACLDKIYNSAVSFHPQSGSAPTIPVNESFAYELFMLRLYKAREEALETQYTKSDVGIDKSKLSHLNQALEKVSHKTPLNDEDSAYILKSLPRLLNHRKNIIAELFQGCTVSVLTCIKCRFSRILHPEEFLVLSLPICDVQDLATGDSKQSENPGNSVHSTGEKTNTSMTTLFEHCTKYMHGNGGQVQQISLIDCMRAHCNSFINHSEGHEPKCPSCKEPQQRIEQRTLFLQLPDILCISFKRFRFDGSWMSWKHGSNKVSTYVYCPLNLNLAEFCTSLEYLPENGEDNDDTVQSSHRNPAVNYSYTLDAVVNHHGFSLLKGHYTSYAYKADLEKWALFNDHHVGEVTPDEVIDSEIYIAVYRRDSLEEASRRETEGSESTAMGCKKLIQLSASLKVDILDDHRTCQNISAGNSDFVSGMKMLHDICLFMNNPENLQKPEEIEDVFSSSTVCQDTARKMASSNSFQILAIPDCFSDSTRPSCTLSSERRLLNIDWVRRSQWLTHPGPITNLPCYCCPRQSNQDHREVAVTTEKSVSQVDRVFSNLYENLKITDIPTSKHAKVTPQYHRYFDGENATCHGKTIGETYVDVSLDLYRKLHNLFGGGPELLPSDLSSMTRK